MYFLRFYSKICKKYSFYSISDIMHFVQNLRSYYIQWMEPYPNILKHILVTSREMRCAIYVCTYILFTYLFKKLHFPWELMSDNHDIYMTSIHTHAQIIPRLVAYMCFKLLTKTRQDMAPSIVYYNPSPKHAKICKIKTPSSYKIQVPQSYNLYYYVLVLLKVRYRNISSIGKYCFNIIFYLHSF